MRTLQPITSDTAAVLIKHSTVNMASTERPWDGVVWEEWTNDKQPDAAPIVRIERNGEDLGWYILR